MSLFLISFIALYGGMHAYAFFRLRQAFYPGRPVTVFLTGCMVFMVFAPLLVRVLEKAGFEKSALWIAWPGYTWMGCVFIFSAALIAMDILRSMAWLANRYFGSTIPGFITATLTCKIALVITLLASGYSLYEARKIRTEHVTVTTAKLSSSSRGIRVVQISDVHVGLLFRESRLESVLQAVRDAHPDILVSTGDLVDGRLSKESATPHLIQMAAMIAAVPTPSGKFAVTGNHEFYAGIEQALEFTRKAGFTTLRNQSITLSNGLTISGIDDMASKRMNLPLATPTEPELLRSAPIQFFQLLLKHRPIITTSSDGLFDLQLSGHVHKGQIFPFNLLVRLEFPIPCGTTETMHHSNIHVSRGSGTWGPPMRLFAPPEVTIIDIIPQPQNTAH